MNDPDTAVVGRIGVAQVQLAVVRDLKWLFREQAIADYGIDAQVEVVDRGTVVPRLLAMQIKSGRSAFDHPNESGWWFYPKVKHARYWLDHSLPVIIVLVDVETETRYWQTVNAQTVQPTSGSGYKIHVPRAQVLNQEAINPLRQLAEGDEYVLRIRELQLAKPWMELLAQGRRLTVDVEEWVNKTSGRGSITLGEDREDGRDPVPLASWGVFLGLQSYAEAVPRLLAWAEVGLHAETYDWAVEYDGDYDGHGSELRPYKNGAGEVDFWRFELTLSSLARAFLVVDQFATNGSRQLTV